MAVTAPTSPALTAVASIDDLDTAWMSRALGHSGATVEALSVSGVVYGSNTKVRMHLDWTGGNTDALPRDIAVKANLAHQKGGDAIDADWEKLHMLLNACEVAFYREVAPAIDMRTPRCHFAETDPGSGQSILILEDLVASDHSFGAFDKPLTADLAALTLEQLARLHAATWRKPASDIVGKTDAMAESGMLEAFLAPVNWEQQMSRPRGRHVPERLRDRDLVSRAIRRAWELKRKEPPLCIVHGDPHVGNIFFTADGQPGFLDFPLSTSGTWAWDFGYCMASSMTIDERRRNERDLLAHYLSHLSALGAHAPSFDDAWLSYRRFSIWGFLAFLTPITVQTEEYNSVVGERHAVAAIDLDALGALGI